MAQIPILCIIGPTASGKSSRAVREALVRNGEIISVDSRQVYRGLDIGTEKIMPDEMRGVPHHLIDIIVANEVYSAGDFVKNAALLILEISGRKKLPILAGGTHFYFDALLNGLPTGADANPELRKKLEERTTEELFRLIQERDPRRSLELGSNNRRRLIRALEIVEAKGVVPPRASAAAAYKVEWIVIDPPREELRNKIDIRLQNALKRGLIDEVRRVREEVGDMRLNELGLEYKTVGEYLRNERTKVSLMPALSSKLWQLARRQKAWLRKLVENETITAASPLRDKS